MAGLDQRLATGCAGDGDVHAFQGIVNGGAWRDGKPGVTRQLLTERLGLLRIARPDPHIVDGPHQAQRLKLQRRLLTGSDQRDAAALLAR